MANHNNNNINTNENQNQLDNTPVRKRDLTKNLYNHSLILKLFTGEIKDPVKEFDKSSFVFGIIGALLLSVMFGFIAFGVAGAIAKSAAIVAGVIVGICITGIGTVLSYKHANKIKNNEFDPDSVMLTKDPVNQEHKNLLIPLEDFPKSIDFNNSEQFKKKVSHILFEPATGETTFYIRRADLKEAKAVSGDFLTAMIGYLEIEGQPEDFFERKPNEEIFEYTFTPEQTESLLYALNLKIQEAKPDEGVADAETRFKSLKTFIEKANELEIKRERFASLKSFEDFNKWLQYEKKEEEKKKKKEEERKKKEENELLTLKDNKKDDPRKERGNGMIVLKDYNEETHKEDKKETPKKKEDKKVEKNKEKNNKTSNSNLVSYKNKRGL